MLADKYEEIVEQKLQRSVLKYCHCYIVCSLESSNKVYFSTVKYHAHYTIHAKTNLKDSYEHFCLD